MTKPITSLDDIIVGQKITFSFKSSNITREKYNIPVDEHNIITLTAIILDKEHPFEFRDDGKDIYQGINTQYIGKRGNNQPGYCVGVRLLEDFYDLGVSSMGRDNFCYKIGEEFAFWINIENNSTTNNIIQTKIIFNVFTSTYEELTSDVKVLI